MFCLLVEENNSDRMDNREDEQRRNNDRLVHFSSMHDVNEDKLVEDY